MQPQTPEEIEKLTNFITTSLMEATKQAIPETKLITTNVCLSEASKRLIANKHSIQKVEEAQQQQRQSSIL
jgi:hypothetical protein